MLKIITIVSSLMFVGCASKPLEVTQGKYPKVEKAKWQGNYASTFEDILRELDERRAIEDSFK
ncbi:MAG: hypothetical protein LHW59_05425 [Candidatus Cloacimonetes bacterium]|nr:hypothetical protein [Candidatus Cloacimonadota bacterium]